jgi:hypothetical protein
MSEPLRDPATTPAVGGLSEGLPGSFGDSEARPLLRCDCAARVTANSARPRSGQRRDMNRSASTTTRVISPAASTLPLAASRALTVNRCRRPSS